MVINLVANHKGSSISVPDFTDLTKCGTRKSDCARKFPKYIYKVALTALRLHDVHLLHHIELKARLELDGVGCYSVQVR
jgi:hypothetical protein